MDILDQIRQMAAGETQDAKEQMLKEALATVVRKEFRMFGENLKECIGLQIRQIEGDWMSLKQDIFKIAMNIDALSNKLNEVQQSILQIKEEFDALMVIKNDLTGSLTKEDEGSKILFASMVDSLAPLGFKKTNLKNDASGCAFIIVMESERNGWYSFVSDESMHQEVLMAFNPIVSDSSIYDYVPINPSKIILEEKGMVEDEGDLLLITKKMKIKFE